MASGVPVVSTPISGIPELVESGVDGLLVPPNDPTALAEAIDKLLASQGLRESLARAARAKIESSFSLDASAERLLALFDETKNTEYSRLEGAAADLQVCGPVPSREAGRLEGLRQPDVAAGDSVKFGEGK
jgi:hypothetical protein